VKPKVEDRFLQLTETQFQRQVTEMAQLLGWHWVHVSHSPQVKNGVVRKYTTPTHGTLGKGWPDLMLIRERDKRLIFAELKSEVGAIRPDQRRVLDVLSSLVTEVVDPIGPGGARVEVYVWRPSDIDEIERLLRT
jgi:hypothetical protein